MPISSSSPFASSPSILGYIEHPISKLDTLVGIAIKYGVEVADLRKMNGLVTDHQMFALKTLQIPLPGRHPPSTFLSNGSSITGHNNLDHSPPDDAHHELFESFQSLKKKSFEQKVSPAMSSLQGFNGLKVTSNDPENGTFSKNLPMSQRPLCCHRKSKSLVNVILEEVMEKSDSVPVAEARDVDSDKWNDKLVRRRQKSEANFTRTPDLILREENGSNGGFGSRTVKGLALRQKAAIRTALMSDSEASGLNPLTIGLGDAFQSDGSSSGVRKSSSTSCLQDQDNSSSIWPTSRWTLKPDLQAFSTAAIGKPIFDGLPKPLTGRRNKAALD